LPLRLLSIVTGVVILGSAGVVGQQPAPAQQPQASSAPLPSAKELVAKHIAAIGGEAAFKAISSLHATGQFELSAQGVTGELDLIAARPAKLLLRVDIASVGHVESGFDGKNGWSIDPLAGPTLLTGRALSEMAEDAWFDSALHSADHVKELTTVARTQFDKRPAYQVKVVYMSGVQQTEYFDAETGFQIGSETERETPMGVLPTTTMLREYKKFGTLMQATVLLQRTMGIDQLFRIASYEYNTVPANAFDPPPQIKALIK
jgi:hypothetical protein